MAISKYVLRRVPLERLWRLLGPRGPLRLLLPVFEPYLSRLQRARWDQDWELESQRPVSELSTVVPNELVEAVESGWIPPSSSVMDIGSGRGQISAWLAERGFRVLGVDLSAEATALAKLHFHHLGERLEFRTFDICTTPPEPGRFDWLVDRGCFHIIPDPLCPRYVANVAAWAKHGAPFLLFCRSYRVDRVPELFDSYFELIRTQPILYSRSVGSIPRVTGPGVAFWMIRRGPAPPT